MTQEQWQQCTASQGFVQLGLGAEELRAVLASIASQAAQHSLVVGELPPMPHQTAQDLLAEAGDPLELNNHSSLELARQMTAA